MSSKQKSFDENDDEIYIEKKFDNDIERLKLNLAQNFVQNFIFNQIFYDKNQMNNPKYENSSNNEESLIYSNEESSIGIEKSLSDENSDSAINLPEIEKKEQINEVKYFFFMVLFNECEYYDEYKEFKNFKKNKLCLRRIIQQKFNFNINKTNFDFGEKTFVFLSRKQKTYQFQLNNKIYEIDLEKNKIKEDEKYLLTNEEFELKYKVKTNVDNNNEILDKFSEDEVKNNLFYDKIGDNEFVRFSVLGNYKKEIDAIFTKHKEIKLNTGKVDLKKAVDDLIKGKETYFDNDLKSIILFKNFDDNSIGKDKPLAMEIKKSSRLSDLIIQLKQDSKIFKYLKLTNDSIELPKYFIGIMCKYEIETVNKESSKLNKSYQGSDIIKNIDHILAIIENMDINIIIGIIKDEKIMDYPLGKCDYDCNLPDVFKRVDLHFLNKKVCEGKYSKNKIDEIVSKYGKIYKSIRIEKAIPYKTLIQEINKKNNEMKEEKEKFDKEKKMLLEENTKLKNLLKKYENP